MSQDSSLKHPRGHKYYFSQSILEVVGYHSLYRTIKAFEEFFKKHHETFIEPQIEELKEFHRININWQIFKKKHNENDFALCQGNINEFLNETPYLFLPIISCSIHQIIFLTEKNNYKINCRIINLNKITKIKELKSGLLGKFVSIRGTVTRVTKLKPIILSMNFKCKKCDNIFNIEFPDGKLLPVINCLYNKNCKGKFPEKIMKTAKMIDFQKIRIQELSNNTNEGRVPRTIDIELTEDLVDLCVPGDVITVNGIVSQIKLNIKNKDKRLLSQVYLNANSIVNIDNKKIINKEMYDDLYLCNRFQRNKLGILIIFIIFRLKL